MVRFYGPKKVNAFLKTLKAIYVSHLHADHHIGKYPSMNYVTLISGLLNPRPRPCFRLSHFWNHLPPLILRHTFSDFLHQTIILIIKYLDNRSQAMRLEVGGPWVTLGLGEHMNPLVLLDCEIAPQFAPTFVHYNISCVVDRSPSAILMYKCIKNITYKDLNKFQIFYLFQV